MRCKNSTLLIGFMLLLYCLIKRSKANNKQTIPRVMAELKTQQNDAPVEDYINALGDEKVIADCLT
jgi:hypothetical protein